MSRPRDEWSRSEYTHSNYRYRPAASYDDPGKYRSPPPVDIYHYNMRPSSSHSPEQYTGYRDRGYRHEYDRIPERQFHEHRLYSQSSRFRPPQHIQVQEKRPTLFDVAPISDKPLPPKRSADANTELGTSLHRYHCDYASVFNAMF